MKYNIMFVDESFTVLESLKWIFKDDPNYLFTFDDPDDALSVLYTVEFAVVVAEREMKKMDGLEFIKRVNGRWPNTLGIIMAGYSGLSDVLDVAVTGCVYRFIKKPLDNGGIKHAVEVAINRYEINAQNKGEDLCYGHQKRRIF